MSRRRVRTLILAAIVTSFVVTATLFLALVLVDDSTRLCRRPLDEGPSDDSYDVPNQSSSVLRQVNIALASNIDHKLPVCGFVRNYTVSQKRSHL